MEDNSIEHEDVAMKLLATSLDEDAKSGSKAFPTITCNLMKLSQSYSKVDGQQRRM
jgi:hypothetical protein